MTGDTNHIVMKVYTNNNVMTGDTNNIVMTGDTNHNYKCNKSYCYDR